MKFLSFINSLFENPSSNTASITRRSRKKRIDSAACKRLQFWVTEAEAKFIKHQAKTSEQTMSEFMRAMVMDGANMQSFITNVQTRPTRAKKRIKRSAPEDHKLTNQGIFKVSDKMLQEIDRQAMNQGVNRGELIRRSLEVYLHITDEK